MWVAEGGLDGFFGSLGAASSSSEDATYIADLIARDGACKTFALVFTFFTELSDFFFDVFLVFFGSSEGPTSNSSSTSSTIVGFPPSIKAISSYNRQTRNSAQGRERNSRCCFGVVKNASERAAFPRAKLAMKKSTVPEASIWYAHTGLV